MTIDEYIELLSSPETVTPEAREDLEALLSYAPYCASARLLYLKILHQTHDTAYQKELPKTVLYTRQRKDAYFLLHPKTIIRRSAINADDYFTFIQQLQRKAEQTGQSFAELAEKFKQARQGLKESSIVEGFNAVAVPKSTTSITGHLDYGTAIAQERLNAETSSCTEAEVQKCIENRDYRGAISRLQDLNLHNPKKSRYFAVQIEFLEKALALQEGQN